MASTSSSGRGYCKHNVAGKACRCQEWSEPSGNDLACDCCAHHMSFHESYHPIKSGFGRCLKEFGEGRSLYEDGCQEFYSSTADARRCEGCGCHRNIHEKVMAVGNLALNVCSQPTPNVDCSAALMEPSYKRLKLDCANISVRVGDRGNVIETNDDINLKSGVSTTANSNHHLESKHKIFLSHSGVQKDFVEHLCKELERHDRYPFFDKRETSLPHGEAFPNLIFDAIRQCQVGVVVLSEEFFTRTKWPMLELVAMVKEREKNGDEESCPKIIPIYYFISLQQCRDPKTHSRWVKQWEAWAKCDKRINIEEWKKVLRIFGQIKGVIKDDGMDEGKCRDRIVNVICGLVLPEIKWDDSHVEGRLRLCKVISKKIYEESDGLIAGVRVMGLYGMGGTGKTTACKVLCNELCLQFGGRVCHIELGRMSIIESFQEVLRKLTNTSHEILRELNNEGECLDMWKRNINRKRPVFLCIDNMSDNQESKRQAIAHLGAGLYFARGSVILVTARSMGDLMCLNAYLHERDCIRMPELEEKAARTLFLNHAFSNKHAREKLDNPGLISRCIQRCYYLKGDGTFHYHPLALQVLGELLGSVGYDSDLWEMHLHRIDMFDDEISGNNHPIFSILRTSYDALSPEFQMLFVDIALFAPSGWVYENLWDWLSMVHGLRADEITRRLEYLIKKSLLDISELGDGVSRVGMHDLWREFSIAETKIGKLRDQRWIYLAQACPKLGESSPSGRCWENLKRMCFMHKGLMSLDELNFDYFCNVTVLKLVGEFSLSNIAIDIGGLKHLKSLEVKNSGNRKLPDISKLTSLRVACFGGNDKVDTITGLSSKLTNLQILDLGGCRSLRSVPGVTEIVALQELSLLGCDRLEELPDISKLTSLRVARFGGNDKVGTITGLSSKLTNLQILDLGGCRSLRSVPGVDEIVALQELSLLGCDRLEELPNLEKLVNLRRLNICGCDSLLRGCKSMDDLIFLEELRDRFGKLTDVSRMSNFHLFRHGYRFRVNCNLRKGSLEHIEPV